VDKFDRHSNYDTKSSYRQIVFGHDNPLLEVELNEMQQLQEKLHRQVRKLRRTLEEP